MIGVIGVAGVGGVAGVVRRSLVAAAVVAASVGGVSGCGDDGPDAAEEAAAGVATVLAERLSVDLDEVGVRCPGDLDVEAGARFTCAVAVGGVEEDLDLAVTADGVVELREAVIPTTDAEAYLAAELAPPAGGPVDPDCGDAPLLVAPVDSTFTCTVVRPDDGATLTVTVTVLDLDGTVRYEVAAADATGAET